MAPNRIVQIDEGLADDLDLLNTKVVPWGVERINVMVPLNWPKTCPGTPWRHSLRFGTRYQSKLFNPTFLKDRGLPVPDWLD